MGLSVFGQPDSTTPPYKRFPTLPPLEILLTDSTTLFGKAQIPANTPVLYMLFDPGCSHCQHETEELVAHKKDFEQIQVVMITMPRSSFAEVNDFINKYRVNELKHVVVGRDITYFMPSFYSIRNFPFLAMYDNKGNLITAFEGGLGMDEVISHFKRSSK
jgi:thiol-disulfide isomerase/thioredoxin